jgi:hypothetical protein
MMREEAPVRCLTVLMLRLYKPTAVKFTICAGLDDSSPSPQIYNLYLCLIFVFVHVHFFNIITCVDAVTAYENKFVQYPVKNG